MRDCMLLDQAERKVNSMLFILTLLEAVVTKQIGRSLPDRQPDAQGSNRRPKNAIKGVFKLFRMVRR